MICESMQCRSMPACIRNSFAHCGMYPVDRSVPIGLLAAGRPDVSIERDPMTKHVRELVTDKFTELIEVNRESMKVKASTPRAVGRKRLFGQQHATVITNVD